VADKRYFRGNLNVVLNGLVRDGVIVGFQTANFESGATGDPEVTVLAGTTVDHEVVRNAVCKALEPVSETLIVTVKAG
jgi:hypothetical protein